MKAAEITEGAVVDGNYRLLGLLGKGGMGEVWEGEHTRLPKRVAVKFLLEAATGQEELVMRFRREAEIASRLVHPSIVEVFDFNVLEDETPYLVMERLVGEDLRSRLDRGLVPLSEASEIIRQVASGLELAHREGVVHRDLKPENLFLCHQADGSMRAKILDFGISKIQGANTNATRDDRILGTPGYMAPEQAMGKNSQVDGRTDIFSLAAIFYEMLTGTSAFIGNTLAEMVYKIVHVAPEPLAVVAPSLPSAISRVVERALSKNPADRYQNVSHFASGISAVELPEKTAAPQRAVDVAGVTHISQDVAADQVAPARQGQQGFGESSARPVDASVNSIETVSGRVSGADPIETQASRSRPGRPWVLIAAAVGMLTIGAGLTFAMAGAFRAEGVSTSVAPEEPSAAVLASSTAPPSALPSAVKAAPTQPGIVASGRSNGSPLKQPVTEQLAADGAHDKQAGAAATAGSTAAVSGGGSNKRKPSQPTEARPSTQSASGTKPAGSKSAELLARSDAALRGGDPDAALRLARSSLYEAKTARAYTLMAKAYCAKRDVGMVRAMLRNLGDGSKRRVRAYCQSHSVNLQ